MTNINSINETISNISEIEFEFELDMVADSLIHEIEMAVEDEDMVFPRMGDSTSQIFEDAEAWIAWKKAEAQEAIDARRAELNA